MSKLVRWQTPFSDAFYPTVTAAFSAPFTGKDNLKIVVGPKGIYDYPKYLITFEQVLTFNCFEEGCAPHREWPEGEYTEPKPCAWEWKDSPSIASYQNCGEFDENNKPFPLFHYLIFGGDYIAEVIVKKEPVIETVLEPTKLTIDFEC